MAIVNSISNPFQISISNVSKLTEVASPDVFIHGIPWSVRVSKDTRDGLWLRAVLFCKDNSENWSHSALCSFKLLSFNDNCEAFESTMMPCVFSLYGNACGISKFYSWKELFAGDGKYVKDDTIKMEFKIEAEDPKKIDKSQMIFECIDRSCESGCYASYRLTVTNITNLFDVWSPMFHLRDVPLSFTIHKNAASILAIYLYNHEKKEFPAKLTVSVQKKSQLSNYRKSIS